MKQNSRVHGHFLNKMMNVRLMLKIVPGNTKSAHRMSHRLEFSQQGNSCSRSGQLFLWRGWRPRALGWGRLRIRIWSWGPEPQGWAITLSDHLQQAGGSGLGPFPSPLPGPEGSSRGSPNKHRKRWKRSTSQVGKSLAIAWGSQPKQWRCLCADGLLFVC